MRDPTRMNSPTRRPNGRPANPTVQSKPAQTPQDLIQAGSTEASQTISDITSLCRELSNTTLDSQQQTNLMMVHLTKTKEIATITTMAETTKVLSSLVANVVGVAGGSASLKITQTRTVD